MKKPFGPPLRLIHCSKGLCGYRCTYCRKDFHFRTFWQKLFKIKVEPFCEHVKHYHGENK